MSNPAPTPSETAPLPFRFHQFGIQYTNRCDYKCAHCGTESGGDLPTRTLGTDFVRPLFPVLRSLGFEEVTITGGECLLFEDEVKSLVSAAKSLGLSTKVISNGSWARTLQAARNMLHNLAQSGLDTLTVSYDRFRQPFGGSLTQVENILDARRSLSRKVRVQVYSVEASPDDTKQNAILARLRELVPLDDLFLQRVIPVGRARLLPARLFTAVPRTELDKPCYQVFSPFLDHQRRLYRCCSGYDLKERSPLFLGTVGSASTLAAHLNRLSDDSLHKALAALGPSHIFSEEFRTRSDLVTLCHFCVEQMAKSSAPEHISGFLSQNRCLANLVYQKTEEALEARPQSAVQDSPARE